MKLKSITVQSIEIINSWDGYDVPILMFQPTTQRFWLSSISNIGTINIVSILICWKWFTGLRMIEKKSYEIHCSLKFSCLNTSHSLSRVSYSKQDQLHGRSVRVEANLPEHHYHCTVFIANDCKRLFDLENAI